MADNHHIVEKIIVCYNTGSTQGAACSGIKFLTKIGKVIMQCGSFYDDKEFFECHVFEVEKNEKFIGVRGWLNETKNRLFDLEFKIAKLI